MAPVRRNLRRGRKHSKPPAQQTCPICGKNKSVIINMHGYEYHRCAFCGHTFLHLRVNDVKKHINKIQSKLFPAKGYTSNGLFTSKFMAHEIAKVDDRLDIIKEVSANDEMILLQGCRSEHLYEESKQWNASIDAYYDNSFFNTVWTKQEGHYVKFKKNKNREIYNSIFVFDHLEFSYCPYDDVLHLIRLIKPGGTLVIELPYNNNPKENYEGRLHEFSDKSLRCFARNICRHNSIRFNSENKAYIICSRLKEPFIPKEEDSWKF